MRINQNVNALNAWRNLTFTDMAMGKSLEKLSSGLRINRAADDAAGLAISEQMRGQIRGLNQAVRNAQDGISLIQTAEGALTETHAILQRMRELAVQAANDTYSSGSAGPPPVTGDRDLIQEEIDQLIAELDRIASTTRFNGMVLLDGTFNATFHIGANAGENLQVSFADMGTASGLGVAGVNLRTQASADAAITTINDALTKVSAERAKLGAVQNRLEHTVANLSVAAENLTAAEGRIRDADMAYEMTRFTRNQIMLQAGTAMLAQANQNPQSVLQLLR